MCYYALLNVFNGLLNGAVEIRMKYISYKIVIYWNIGLCGKIMLL